MILCPPQKTNTTTCSVICLNKAVGSLKEYVGKIGEEKEHLYLITLDGMKWDRYFSDVEAVYEYFELFDYWEHVKVA